MAKKKKKRGIKSGLKKFGYLTPKNKMKKRLDKVDNWRK